MITNTLNRYTLPSGVKMYLDPERTHMEKLMSQEQWEWRKLAIMRQHLKPGSVFVDVGAFNGYFSLLANQMVGRDGLVCAIEPDDRVYHWLMDNLHTNLMAINPKTIAFGRQTCDDLLYYGEQLGFSSLTDRTDQRQWVCVWRWDEFFSDSVLSVDMAKIDVEGGEVGVLEGMSGGPFPKIILFDLHPERGVDMGRVDELLKGYGYSLFDIRNDNAPLKSIPPMLVELMAVRNDNA